MFVSLIVHRIALMLQNHVSTVFSHVMTQEDKKKDVFLQQKQNDLIMLQRIFLSTLLASFCLWCSPQGFIITNLPTQKQLPVANIHAILQDREGYMWYATYGGGLCRDNGYQIDVFRSDRNHPGMIGNSNDITCIAEDQQNRIIFGNRDGAYILDKSDYSITLLDPELKGKKMEAAYVTRNGEIWLSANPFVYQYNASLKRIGKYRSTWLGKEQTVTSFYEDSKGNIWMTQWDGGILQYNRKRSSLDPQPWIDGITPARIIEDAQSHCFWVSTWGKEIMKYQPSLKKIEPQACCSTNSTLASQTMDMRLDASQRILWTSTMEGLHGYRITEGQLHPIQLETLLPKGIYIIDGLTIDKRNNLWVSGFSPLTFILSPKRDGIVRHNMDALVRSNHALVWNTAKEGNALWIGQDRLGICIYDLSSQRLLVANEQEGDKTYLETDMAWFCKRKDKQGIWCYHSHDAFWVHLDRGRFVKEKICQVNTFIKSLYDDGKGHLYIGKHGGMDIFHTKTGTVSHEVSCQGHVSDIIKAKDGTLYFVSSKEGLMCKERSGKVRVLSTLGDFTSLTLDHTGNLWAADKQGNVICYHPKTRQVTIDEKGSNLKGDAIKDMVMDAYGHLWIVSDQFVKEYNPESGACRILYCQDKNISMDNFCSVSIDGKRVTVCGTKAILSINTSSLINGKKSDAVPHITAVTIGSKEHIIGMNEQQVEVRPDDINVTFQFSTLNPLNVERVTYAYRLKGLNSDWHTLPTGNNKASFFKLAKGDYVLEVKATDEFGRWSNTVTSLKIHRIPAWFESWWAYSLYALLAVMIAVYLFRLYLSMQKRKQQQQLQEQLTELKFRFFTNISHELRTPLTLILTPLQSLLKRLTLWHEDAPEDERIRKMKSQVTLVNDNANRLLTLVNRLLDFRKLEMGQTKLELTSGDVLDFIRNVCETFRPMSQEKGIGLGVAIPNKSLLMYFDANKLRHILSNLLSNAFKFTQEGGNIVVSVTVTDDHHVHISVKDNGCGIDAHDLQHIFERYYQVAQQHKDITGTGIGLNMVQEFVQLHQGSVEVTSKVGEGTTFIVSLPTDLKPSSHPEPSDVPQQEYKEFADEASGNPQEKPSLLVVDDNDEFRQFLVGELADMYHVTQASNGEDALKLIADQSIDLVVSDVMMPGMDGMTLCQHIKQDVNTSHVMVILLTARAAEESKIEGFRSGADDYLSKPFNMEMLHLRIAHLLDLRNKRMQQFNQADEVKVEDVANNEIDQKFLRDAMEAVEKNLSNDAYSVEMFCSDLCMSRSTCYRKLLSLTGQKPTEFIRTIRLKNAARLIKDGTHSVSEVSYLCGFSSVSYFCRCFKSQYGVQPGNYTSGSMQ